MIYLDNAATSYQKPEAVYQAVQEAMHHMGNSGRGAHGASLDASRQIYSARELLAELFHAGDPSRVAFTANSTESLNMAVFGLFGPGDHVITTMLEHNSVLRPLYLLEEAGLELTILPADQNGCICYEDIEKAIRPNTKGIICTHASNLTGNMVDIGRIGRFCKKKGLLFVVDASQTAGVFDINMEEMGIDVLCFTGHKGLLGPQGTAPGCCCETSHCGRKRSPQLFKGPSGGYADCFGGRNFKRSRNCRTLRGFTLYSGNWHGADQGKRAFSDEAVLRWGENHSGSDHLWRFYGAEGAYRVTEYPGLRFR